LKTLVSWSSGKDSAWMVHVLRQRADVHMAGLLTTINESAHRVAMHAVRVDVLQAQADALGLPLWQIAIPSPCPNEVYERAMGEAVARAVAEGSLTSRSAISSWRTYGVTARSGSPARGWRRCFRSSGPTRQGSRAR
jgi:diphthamide synthase (EF-2-diphthine--ammonia ligase)